MRSGSGNVANRCAVFTGSESLGLLIHLILDYIFHVSAYALIDRECSRETDPRIEFPLLRQLHILEEEQYDKQLLMPSVQKLVGVLKKFLLDFSVSLTTSQIFLWSCMCVCVRVYVYFLF